MTSKYALYWIGIIDKIEEGIIKSISNNCKVTIPINEITSYGSRKQWYGIVKVSKSEIKGGEMAHASSLGKIVKERLIDLFNDAEIQLKITNGLMLEITALDRTSDEIAHTKQPQKLRPELKNTIEKIKSLGNIIYDIHPLLEQLPLFDYSYNKAALPENGIYFFYENYETYDIDNQRNKRIVRVGTHNVDNRFRDRIRNHYRGNKNSSVFRTHIGSAIIKKNKIEDVDIIEWMKHMTPSNDDIEKLIDETMNYNFSFRCIPVDSKAERLFLEKKLIATLTNNRMKPSTNWLGHHAFSEEIRSSGLWNVQHVFSKSMMNTEDYVRLRNKVISIIKNESKFTEPLTTHHIIETNDKIMIFIPCCKAKEASGHFIDNIGSISKEELPNMWNALQDGRNFMEYCINFDSPKTIALGLYKGHFYKPLIRNLNNIISSIQSGRYRIIIISAGYGIIDALEPLHNYDEEIKGRVATNWKRVGLDKIIADLLLNEKPTRVYGFFAGEDYWSQPGSKDRYFFTEGTKIAIRNGLQLKSCGCFYRKDGKGASAILGALGRTFIEFLQTQFDENYSMNVSQNGRIDGNIEIGFNRIN